MSSVTIKRGETFKFTGTVNGLTAGLSGWTLDSQIRQRGALIDQLIVTITDSGAGEFTVEESAAGVTLTWPLASSVGLGTANGLKWDIRLVTPLGRVLFTETIDVEVIDQQTED